MRKRREIDEKSKRTRGNIGKGAESERRKKGERDEKETRN